MNGSSALASVLGIQRWMQTFDRSATAVSAAAEPDDARTDAGPDLVDGLVGMQTAVYGVKANITVLRASDEMLGTLLDMQA